MWCLTVSRIFLDLAHLAWQHRQVRGKDGHQRGGEAHENNRLCDGVDVVLLTPYSRSCFFPFYKKKRGWGERWSHFLALGKKKKWGYVRVVQHTADHAHERFHLQSLLAPLTLWTLLSASTLTTWSSCAFDFKLCSLCWPWLHSKMVASRCSPLLHLSGWLGSSEWDVGISLGSSICTANHLYSSQTVF